LCASRRIGSAALQGKMKFMHQPPSQIYPTI
jgi:hypothetical protein